MFRKVLFFGLLLLVLCGCTSIPHVDDDSSPTQTPKQTTVIGTSTATTTQTQAAYAKSCAAYNDVGFPLVDETDQEGQPPQCHYAMPPIQQGQTRLHSLAITTVQSWCHLTPQSDEKACHLSRFEQAKYNGVVYERAVHLKGGSPVEIDIPSGMMAQVWDKNGDPSVVTGPSVLPQVFQMWVVDP